MKSYITEGRNAGFVYCGRRTPQVFGAVQRHLAGFTHGSLLCTIVEDGNRRQMAYEGFAHIKHGNDNYSLHLVPTANGRSVVALKTAGPLGDGADAILGNVTEALGDSVLEMSETDMAALASEYRTRYGD